MRTAKTLDQTGRMPRLNWVFAGRTAILLVLSCRGSYTLGPKYPRYMYIRTYKQYNHVYWVQEIHERINLNTFRAYMLFRKKKKKKKKMFLLWPEKNILALALWEKKNLCFFFFLSEENLEEKTQPSSPPPTHPRRSNGRSLNRFSRDVAHMVSCYFFSQFSLQ